jgi:hypothetical protein
MPELSVQHENNYTDLSQNLSLAATHYCQVEITTQTGNLNEDYFKPVEVTVPPGTKFVHVAIIGVRVSFQDQYLQERPLAKLYYEIQKGQINGNQFKFVIVADLRDQYATVTWAAKFGIELTYFR